MTLLAEELLARVEGAQNRLAKWRSAFAGWQLGTRPMQDPEAQAVRDHREVTMMLRAEVNALSSLLVSKGVFSNEEYLEQLVEEYTYLADVYEEKFPGFEATDEGLRLDPLNAAKTMAGWRP